MKNIYTILLIIIPLIIISIYKKDYILNNLLPDYNKYNSNLNTHGFEIFKNLFSENDMNFLINTIDYIEKNYKNLSCVHNNNGIIENIDRYSMKLSGLFPFISDKDFNNVCNISIGKILDQHLYNSRYNLEIKPNRFTNDNFL